MAADFYLRIEGVKGESTDSKHQGWIECASVAWSITQPRSATSSTGGGHTAERAELSDINISKLVDMASPLLAQLCAGGKTIPRAKLEMQRADGNGDPVKYFEVELENVLIAHVAPSFAGSDFPTESVGLKFSKARWKYTKQKIGGGSSGNTAGGWDLSANRIA